MLSYIPGQVGASAVQNIGAYGQEVAETISAVRAFDLSSEMYVEIENTACGFSYRNSKFKEAWANRFVITSITYSLWKEAVPTNHWDEVLREIRESGSAVSLKSVRSAILRICRRKSMVIDVRDPMSRGVGSFFLNPDIDDTTLSHILRTLREGERNDPLPIFYDKRGGRKIAAAWLIERAGIYKGLRFDDAAVSTKHSLAIVNLGKAKAYDILKLAAFIRLWSERWRACVQDT